MPTQELIDQLSGLGEMDDLLGNEVVPPSAAPGTVPSAPGTSTDDLLDDDFNFDASGSKGSDSDQNRPDDQSSDTHLESDRLNPRGAASPKQSEAETDQVFDTLVPQRRLEMQAAARRPPMRTTGQQGRKPQLARRSFG